MKTMTVEMLDEITARHDARVAAEKVLALREAPAAKPPHPAPAAKPSPAPPAPAAVPDGGFRCSCGWTAGGVVEKRGLGGGFALTVADRGAFMFATELRAKLALESAAAAHRVTCPGRTWQSEPPPDAAHSCKCGWTAALKAVPNAAFAVSVTDRGAYLFGRRDAAVLAVEACWARHRAACPKAGA